jgi:hypothetical protein
VLATKLQDAFEKTRYVVMLPGAKTIIRAGKPVPPVIDKVLAEAEASCWSFVTAWNPGSVKQTADENNRLHAKLQAAVAEGGWQSFPGEGVGVSAWLAEKSLLIIGATRDDGLALGRRFDQLAIVFGERGQAAELLEC